MKAYDDDAIDASSTLPDVKSRGPYTYAHCNIDSTSHDSHAAKPFVAFATEYTIEMSKVGVSWTTAVTFSTSKYYIGFPTGLGSTGTAKGRDYDEYTFFVTASSEDQLAQGTIQGYNHQVREKTDPESAWSSVVEGTVTATADLTVTSLSIGTEYEIIYWAVNEVGPVDGIGELSKNYTISYTHQYVPKWGVISDNTQTTDGTDNKWCFTWALTAGDADANGGDTVTSSEIWLSSSATFANVSDATWKMVPTTSTTSSSTETCIKDQEVIPTTVSALECEAIIYVAIAPVNSLGSASLSTVSPASFIYTTTDKKTTCKPSDSFDSSSAAMSGDTITVTIAGGKDGNSNINDFSVSHGVPAVTCTVTFVSVTSFTISYA